MKRLLIILAVCLLYSCSIKRQEQKVDLVPLLTQTLDDSLKEKGENLLCMFISDDMCSACVEKEFINIKTADIPVTLVGLYNDKRVFASSTSQLSWGNVIFIKREEKHSKIIPQVIYFIYNPKEKTCSEIFYPDPCDETRTFTYFQKITNSMYKKLLHYLQCYRRRFQRDTKPCGAVMIKV